MISVGVIWLFLSSQRIQDNDLLVSNSLITSELLLKQKGVPKNWNMSNVEVIGLVGSNHLFDEGKINSFLSLYSNNKSFLKKVIGFKHDFYFNVRNLSSGLSLYNNSVNPDNFSQTFIVQRYNMINNSVVVFEFGTVKK